MTTEKITNKNISRLNLYVGQSWNNAKKNNATINSIFKDIDDGDGIIQENELVILNESFDFKRKVTPQKAFARINYADYTKEELVKRYPANKYELRETTDEETKLIEIKDKSTGKNVLEVASKNGEEKSTIIVENNSKGELIMRRCYDSDGNLSCYDDSERVEHNPIADLLHQDVCAKNSFGLPTTGPKIEEHAKMITSKDVIKVLDNYEKRFGETLERAIKGERNLDKGVKDRILKHITQCLEKAYNYDRNYKNDNSVISNKYHKGNTYSVTQNGDDVLINNKTKNRTIKLNLWKLTNDLPLHQQVKMKAILQRLPGEVLEDIADEGIEKIRAYDFSYMIDKTSPDAKEKFLKSENDYLRRNDNVVFDINSNFETLIPKIGLALNYSGFMNNSTIDKNQQFMNTFTKEFEAYKNAGNKTNMDAKDTFAQCYSLLMTGTCENQEDIEKYFQETIEQSNQHIAHIRTLPTFNRRISQV